MSDIHALAAFIQQRFSAFQPTVLVTESEVTVEIAKEYLTEICLALRDEEGFKFEMLMDVCGVDYLHYGLSEWQTESATRTGFERGVEKDSPERVKPWQKPRFAVVYHLLSITLNQRLRIRIFADNDLPVVTSVINIWRSADWFEREVFDLFGILFEGHPDLRRILTDYGFIGHPFRKDFPLIGNVEARYDAAQKRVIYEPVSIQPRTLVPKVIRQDNRYAEITSGEKHG